MESTTSKNKITYRSYIEEIFNQGKLELLDQYVTDDYTLHDAPPNIDSGKKAIEQVVSMFKGAFPDFKITLDHLVAEDAFVASKATFEGTHSGNIFGLDATGRRVKISSLTMVSFENGKIKESWVRNDMESLKRQIEG
ncbi:MAG: ester cyclase [Oligoflexales bacterium]